MKRSRYILYFVAKRWPTGPSSDCCSHIQCMLIFICSYENTLTAVDLLSIQPLHVCQFTCISPRITESKSLNGDLQTQHLLSLGPQFKQRNNCPRKTFSTRNSRGKLRTSHSRGIRSSAEIYSEGVDSPCCRQDVPDKLRPVGERINKGGGTGRRVTLLFLSHAHTHHFVMWAEIMFTIIRLCPNREFTK